MRTGRAGFEDRKFAILTDIFCCSPIPGAEKHTGLPGAEKHTDPPVAEKHADPPVAPGSEQHTGLLGAEKHTGLRMPGAEQYTDPPQAEKRTELSGALVRHSEVLGWRRLCHVLFYHILQYFIILS